MKKKLFLSISIILGLAILLSCIVEQTVIEVTTSDSLDESKMIFCVLSTTIKSYDMNVELTKERLINDVILNDAYVKIFCDEQKSDLEIEIITDLSTLTEGTNKIEFSIARKGKIGQQFFVNIHCYSKVVINNIDDSDRIPIRAISMSTKNFVVDDVVVGDTFVLPAPTFTPANTTQTDLFYLTSSEDIATVDTNGVVTRRGTGSVTIRIQSAIDETIFDEVSLTFFVPLSNIVVNDTHLYISANQSSGNILFSYLPSYTDEVGVSFSCDNPSVCNVDENGVVHRVSSKGGSALITITSRVNPLISATVIVKVYESEVLAPSSIVISSNVDESLNGTYVAVLVSNFNDETPLYQSTHLIGTKAEGFFTPSQETTYRVLTSNIAEWSYIEIRLKTKSAINFWARGENADSSLDGVDENCSDPLCLSRKSDVYRYNYGWNANGGQFLDLVNGDEFITIGYLIADGGSVYHYANGNYSSPYSFLEKTGGGLKEWVSARNYFHLGIHDDYGRYSDTVIDYIAFYKKQ